MEKNIEEFSRLFAKNLVPYLYHHIEENDDFTS
ncbi:hypothetical protein J2Z52_001738 [Enterococcus rivorum]|nr:hypothetical protein [Enterococcus rivorum]